MLKKEIRDLEYTATKVREHIIKMTARGGCFIGASLSCTDLIVYLYKKFLNINLNNLNDPKRDYLFLSKGHDVPALYGTFIEMGWMDAKRLNNHCSTDDDIYWHPNRNIPGVEFHSGSLGHLLPVSIGVALDCKIQKSNNKIVTILGDGELNEGSIWEALLFAGANRIDNLLLVIDRNEFQANMRTEELIPLEPLDKKFEAFGCSVKIVDGHDFNELDKALRNIPFQKDKVSVLIAKTKRGKGLPSLLDRADRWFCKFTEDEVEQLLEELHGNKKSQIKSKTLMVR